MIDTAEINYIQSELARGKGTLKTRVNFMSKEVINKVRQYHESFPKYQITPLHCLDQLSKRLSVKAIWIKDESYRFGLNSFKALGGTYAIGKYLAEELDMDISELSFQKLTSKKIKEKLGNITFVTATDGNHGRGIAWVARQLGYHSIVFMPKGSSIARINSIKNEGAEVHITDLNYDDAVRLASKYTDKHNGVLIQDNAWEGYEKIPTWIMQGYSTLVVEAIEQIKSIGEDQPTHVFLQAGVGSFAGGVLGYLVSVFGEKRPITIIVEPNDAACLYKSIKVGDGQPHAVLGDMSTIMVGLACGEPNVVSWGILRDYADMFVTCSDSISARGMRILGDPLKGDPQVISGESGAVSLGVLSCIREARGFSEIASKLNIDRDSKILIISTEGNTDPEHYREIVWDGAYSSYKSKRMNSMILDKGRK